MLKKIILIILLGPFFIFPQSYRVEKLSLDEGISLNLNYKMLVDHNGYLWFGTMFGLVKYDGESYKVFRHDADDSTSISFDDIISLFEDNKGNIWVGTWGGGLNKLNPNNEKFTRYVQANNSNSISSNIIWAITQDKFGNIWAGLNSGILNKLDFKNNSITKVILPEIPGDTLKNKINRVNNLLADDNFLWICSNGKLFKYNLTKGSYDTALTEKYKNEYVNIVFKDSKNNFWLGANGLIQLNENYEIKNKYSSDKTISNLKYGNLILSIAEDNHGNILTGTRNGLNKFEYGTRIYSKLNIENDRQNKRKGNFINQILVDKGGIIWASSYETGVYKIIPQDQRFRNYFAYNNTSNELSALPVKTIAETKTGEVFIGSYGAGILSLDTTNNRLEYLKATDKNNKFIKSFAVDNIKLWVGGNNGLSLYNLLRKKFEIVNFKNSSRKNFDRIPISSLMIDSKDRLWIGTDGFGLYTLNQDSNEISFININSETSDGEDNQKNYILTLKEDNEGNIWIGTYAGLFKYNDKDSSVVLYGHDDKNKNSLSNNYVFSICEDNNRNLWIGTSDGLNKYNHQIDGFEKYFEKDGLPNGVINSIIADFYGNLWISTNKGISKFNISAKHFDNFDIKDGLSSSLFLQDASLLGSDGNIYFGNQKGVCVFNPNNIKQSNFSPPVYIMSLKIRNNEKDDKVIVNPSGKINLNYNQNFIQIKFASLDYSHPQNNLYKYKLTGIENDWISSGNINFVNYKNLSPGEYTFVVIGSNSSGVWGKNKAELRIIVMAPFWQTWWFIGLAILFSLVIIYLINKIVVNRKLKHAIKIEKIKLEVRDKVRRQTASDFHDEIGHRLTRISILAELIKRKLPEPHSTIEPFLKKISENSAELYSGTKDFVWSIDPKNDTLYELIIRLKDFGDDIFNDTDIHFEVNGISENLKNELLSVEVRRHLSLIFKEGMNNTLKYSNGNNVFLKSEIIDNELEITLADDGEGFSILEETKGNGLRNMKKRAEKIKGVLNIDSRIGDGTKIIFKCKLLQKEMFLN